MEALEKAQRALEIIDAARSLRLEEEDLKELFTDPAAAKKHTDQIRENLSQELAELSDDNS